jgi:hypothetical protein
VAIDVNLSTGEMNVVDGHTVEPQPLPNPTWIAATDNGVVVVVETYGEKQVEGKHETTRNDG